MLTYIAWTQLAQFNKLVTTKKVLCDSVTSHSISQNGPQENALNIKLQKMLHIFRKISRRNLLYWHLSFSSVYFNYFFFLINCRKIGFVCSRSSITFFQKVACICYDLILEKFVLILRRWFSWMCFSPFDQRSDPHIMKTICTI